MEEEKPEVPPVNVEVLNMDTSSNGADAKSLEEENLKLKEQRLCKVSSRMMCLYECSLLYCTLLPSLVSLLFAFLFTQGPLLFLLRIRPCLSWHRYKIMSTTITRSLSDLHGRRSFHRFTSLRPFGVLREMRTSSEKLSHLQEWYQRHRANVHGLICTHRFLSNPCDILQIINHQTSTPVRVPKALILFDFLDKSSGVILFQFICWMCVEGTSGIHKGEKRQLDLRHLHVHKLLWLAFMRRERFTFKIISVQTLL